MDPQPNGGSPSSSSSCSQRKARKRPRDSDEDLPSLGSETSPDSAEPGAVATTSKVLPSLEDSHKTRDKDSESSAEDLAITRKSPGRDEEHAGPIYLSTMKNLYGLFTGETLDFRLPCTATAGTACQILGHLSAWNEFLCLVSWALQEMPGTSGKLSLLFFRNPSLIYCSPQYLHLITLLACQLLKTHRCVAHVELHISLFESHHELLSDALRGSPSVTSVKLIFGGGISGEDLATAALSLPHLQKLEYRGYTHDTATLVGRLSAFLRTTMSLTVLRVSCECLIGLSSDDFLGALSQNCSLKELVLPSRLIDKAPPSAQAVFTECLKNSVSFTSLTVIEGCPPSILEGLLGNRSIVAVHFRHADVDQVNAQLASKIFEQNKVLQSFKISYKFVSVLDHVEFVRGRPDKAGWDRCLKALIENRTLEEVALPIDVWDEDQWKELFEALPTKRNLKRVSIEAIYRKPRSFLGKLCAALSETGADEKVSFNNAFAAEEFDERFECKAFSSVRVDVWDFNRAAVSRIFSCMPPLGHITWLYLNIPIAYKLNGAPFSALASFLGGTRTLKTLILNAFEDVSLYEGQEALMEGLALNTSLTVVQIYVDVTNRDFSEFSEPLADTINASRNISRVNFEVRKQDSVERTFLRRLSTGMPDNYTLLSVTTGWYRKYERSWFKVWDATRRNFSLLTGAADFARGVRRDRRCALALERMHGHPELVEEVARLEKVDQARAAAMVRDGLRSIEGMHAFMRMAGVVKESVSCHACRDGRTQLDALNEDCWRALRCYVKLYDVKDSTTGVPAQ